MKENTSIGVEIRRRRRAAGLSQFELASTLNRTQAWLSALERSLKTPNADLTAKILEAISRLKNFKDELREKRKQAAIAIAPTLPRSEDALADLRLPPR